MHPTKSALRLAPIRVMTFLVLMLVLWLPGAALCFWLINDANTLTIAAMALLLVAFLLLLFPWTRRVHRRVDVLTFYGLSANSAFFKQMGWGVLVGLAGVSSLFYLQGAFGWLFWQSRPEQLGRLVLEGGLVAIGVAFAEELFFRGWLLVELEQNYRPRQALALNSFIFAVLHFLKPVEVILQTLPQFAGLLLLGATLVQAKRSVSSLSLPIGLHAGLVWGFYLVNVGQWVQYSGKVPTWITGLGGNPLAGVMGCIFLAAISLAIAILPNQRYTIK